MRQYDRKRGGFMKSPLILTIIALFSFSALGNTYLQKPRAVKEDQKDATFMEQRKIKARENQKENDRAQHILRKQKQQEPKSNNQSYQKSEDTLIN
jgi:hypothetical protein